MSFIGQIGVRLSGDNSDFKASMEDAGMAAEKFDKQVKKFGLGFGGVAAIATAFRAIVDYARDLENPMDENLKRAQGFAKSIDEGKGFLLEFGAKALGVVNSLGEWWGRMIAIKLEGREQVELAEKIAKQGEEAAATARANEPQQKRINELKKEMRDLNTKIQETEEKNLDLIEQAVLHQGRLNEAEKEYINNFGNKLAMAEAEAKMARENFALAQLESAMQKKDAEDNKEAEKTTADFLKERLKLLDERKKMIFETKNLEEQILEKEQDARKVQQQINWEKGQGWETLESENQLMKINLDLGKLREKSAAAAGEEEKRIAETLKKQNELRYQAVGIVNAVSNQDQSTEILQEKAANLRAQLSDIEAQDFSAGASVGGRIRNPFRGIVTANLQATERELGLRSEVSANVARYGEQGARRFFGGSLSEFERILKAIAPADSSDRTATGIDEINKRLENSGLFPKF